MAKQGGGASGGVPNGQDEHSDWVGNLEKLPQANGGVPAKITSRQCARPNEYETSLPEERPIGDITKDMYGSMNRRPAGKMQDGGEEIQSNKSGEYVKSKIMDGHSSKSGIHGR